MQLWGSQNILLGGKDIVCEGVCIRGDLTRTSRDEQGKYVAGTSLTVGRYCVMSRGCVIRPPGKVYQGYMPPRRLCC